MQYMMKQKLFSLGTDFYIKDESGQDRYFVDGKAFSFGDQLSFQDLSGRELCFIKQGLVSWGPTYQIFKGEELWATVKKELFTFFRASFDIEEPGAAPLEAEGDFTDHRYTFKRGGNPVPEVSMKFFSLADTYGVDIVDGEEDVLILACTVVIDWLVTSIKTDTIGKSRSRRYHCGRSRAVNESVRDVARARLQCGRIQHGIGPHGLSPNWQGRRGSAVSLTIRALP